MKKRAKKACHQCGRNHPNSKHRRRGRKEREARPPLHEWDNPKRAPHWGDPVVSRAKVRGKGTRIITPDAAAREASERSDMFEPVSRPPRDLQHRIVQPRGIMGSIRRGIRRLAAQRRFLDK